MAHAVIVALASFLARGETTLNTQSHGTCAESARKTMSIRVAIKVSV